VGRSARDNPFTPGFGNLPRVFAGRRAEFSDLELMVERLADGTYEQARMVTADRGFGKTSLLREFEQEQREGGHWVVRAVATRGDSVVGRLSRQLAQLVADHDLTAHVSDVVAAALRRLAGVSLGPGGVSLDFAPEPAADIGAELQHVLDGAARLARDAGTILLVLVDETQNVGTDALGALFYAIQEVQGTVVESRDPASGALRRDALPLGVVVAALPGLVDRLRRAGSTFGERSRPLRLGLLTDADLREGIRALVQDGGADIDADALALLAARCGGYPYFLHVYGQQVWNAGSGDLVTVEDARAGIAAAQPLVDDFYEQRLRELGDAQRQYVAAAAALPGHERTSAGVAAALGAPSAALGSTQQALVERHGLLRHAGDGRLVFTLPGLDEHLVRTRG
jgi:hypothetical protein